MGPHEVSEGNDLQKTEDTYLSSGKLGTRQRGTGLTKGTHMLASPDGLETNEGDLHAGKCTDGIPRRISHVESTGESTHEDQDQSVKWNHVGDESVST